MTKSDISLLKELLQHFDEEISHMSCDEFEFTNKDALAEILYKNGDYETLPKAAAAVAEDSSCSLSYVIDYFLQRL